MEVVLTLYKYLDGGRPKVIVINQNIYYNITMVHKNALNKWKGFEIMNIKLIQKRKELNMSQIELAQKLNICKRSYIYKEFQKRQFTESEIKKLMELLDAEFNELF
jgi:DNA-binding XRE family transcriptional regulator